MPKSLLSALGLAVALALSMPTLGNAQATNQHRLHHQATPHGKSCAPTTTHSCPMHHKTTHKPAHKPAPKKTY